MKVSKWKWLVLDAKRMSIQLRFPTVEMFDVWQREEVTMFSGLVQKQGSYLEPRVRRCRTLIYELSSTQQPPTSKSPSAWIEGLLVNNPWYDVQSWIQALLSLFQSYKKFFISSGIMEVFDYYKLNTEKWPLTVHGLVNALHSQMCDSFTHPDWIYVEVEVAFK